VTRADARAFVNGVSVPLERIAPRSIGFGRPVTDREGLAYELRIPLAPAVDALRASYVDLRDDDDPAGYDDDTLRLLRTLGWPPLEELAALHPDAFDAFFLWSLPESLHAVFGALIPGKQEGIAYGINSVRAARPESGEIVVAGSAYAVG